MNVAVIGWGSLVWNPGTLDLRTGWHADGPTLPLEFARISDGGRLTLVLFPRGENRTTYWAITNLENFEDAKANLARREGSSVDAIHFCVQQPSGRMQRFGEPMVTATVAEWLDARVGLDAAIWTGLTSNWQSQRGAEFSVDDALLYLAGLKGSQLDAAREYITRAPPQSDTPVRRAMRARGWHNANLPGESFAGNDSNDE